MEEKKPIFKFLELGILELLFAILVLFIILATLVVTNVIHIHSFHLPSPFRYNSPQSAAQPTPNIPNVDAFTQRYDKQKAQKFIYQYAMHALNPKYQPLPSNSIEQNFLVSNNVITQSNEFQTTWTIPNDPSQFNVYLDYIKGSNQIQRIILFITRPISLTNGANLHQTQQKLLVNYFSAVKNTHSCSDFKQPHSYCVITTQDKNPLIQNGTYFDGKNLILFTCEQYTNESTTTGNNCVDL